jgi:hypothetical protein
VLKRRLFSSAISPSHAELLAALQFSMRDYDSIKLDTTSSPIDR